MNLTRRAAILGGLAMPLAGSAAPPVRVGVLRFGAVAWELDVIGRHQLDAAHDVRLAPSDFASAQATQVALQAGAVDVTAQDWLWVARQRSAGADWTYVAISTAIGALLAPPDSPVHAVTDLPGRRLGIAGSPLDKSWLILRAYAQRLHGIDLDATVTKNFGPPPLLAQQSLAGRLDAVLTFWPFAARAQAQGARRVLLMEEAVRSLGIAGEMPVAGYVFSERWAQANAGALTGLLAASVAAREILVASDEEWQRLAPLTGAGTAAELEQLKQYYRNGVPHAPAASQEAAAGALYAVLAQTGGEPLVGAASTLPPGTFWQHG